MLRRALCLVFVAALGLSVAACDQEGDCQVVVTKVDELVSQAGAAAENANDKAALEHSDLLAACEKQGVTKKQERCVLEAKSLSDVLKCEKR